MEEIFKDIKGYEKRYQISNIGNVKSLSRKINNNTSSFISKERILTPIKDKQGYILVNFRKGNGRSSKKIHKLVLEAFVPNLLNKPCVNHINGIKHDNRLENLEWATHSENTQHAFRTGLMTNNWCKKKVLMLSLDDAPLLIFDSQREANRLTNINQSNISACCRGKYKTAGGYKWRFTQ